MILQHEHICEDKVNFNNNNTRNPVIGILRTIILILNRMKRRIGRVIPNQTAISVKKKKTLRRRKEASLLHFPIYRG